MAGEIHAINVEKGFWDSGRSIHEVLLLIVSEVTEAQDELRIGSPIVTQMYESDSGVRSHNQSGVTLKPVGFPSELADVIIRTLDLCAAYDIDIDKAVMEKIAYNKTRPYKHGKQF
jgi:NTP pyrophosphatase (non-canonical NTP hydrolase)